MTEFEIISDTTPPILSESTPVTTPTTDHTPDYTFNTDEAGDISYGGSCTSATTTATVGDNTITFDTLSDGVYNDCTITVTDASSNSSDPLTVTEFEVDTTAPTITNVSSDKTNGSYTTGEVIDIDITFSEIVTSTGSVTVTLETGTTDRTCTFTVTSSNTGTCNYTVQSGDTTSDLTVNNISGTINDVALNAMSNFVPTTNLAANKALVIDTTAPTIATVTENHYSSYGYLPKYNQLQPNTNTTCVSLFTSNINIVLGKINNVDDVKKLETFLNDFQGEKLDVNGIYEQKDFEAVKRFQQKYFTDIISPFNGKQVTGIVAQYTRGKINLLNCAKQIGCPYFTQNQKIGSTNGDVKRIQNFLNLLMGTNIEETGVFDNQTYLSVKKYQNLYKESVLKPLGLKSATGFWYEKSREAGNKLMGCYI